MIAKTTKVAHIISTDLGPVAAVVILATARAMATHKKVWK
jgi:hypothetical protein